MGVSVTHMKMDGCNYHDNHDAYFDITMGLTGECIISNTTFQGNTLQLETHKDAGIFLFNHQHVSSILFQECLYIGNNASLVALHVLSAPPPNSILTLQFSSSFFQKNYFYSLNQPVLTGALTSSCLFIDYAIINSTFVGNKMSEAMFLHGVNTAQDMCVTAEIRDSAFRENNGSLVLFSDNA